MITLAQFFVELHKNAVLVLDLQFLVAYLIAEEEALRAVLQLPLQVVVLRNFAQRLQIALQRLRLLPHL